MRENCVLVDFNNLCFRTLFTKDVGLNQAPTPDWNIWRYMVFDAIYKLIQKFDNVIEVVLAVDDVTSWRRSYFPRYKESRKKKREKQEEINWEEVFANLVGYAKDLKHHMPFKVLKIKSSEADDIIGTIAISIELDCIISSNDEDYLQLYSDRVKIWNPSKKEFVVCEDPERFLIQKCLTGQSKDDIFNVITPNDWGKTEQTQGKRKPGLGIKTAEKILAEGYLEWLESKGEYKKFDTVVSPKQNFKRNMVLIDFRKIPNTIKDRILDAYYDYSFPPPKNIKPFFHKYKMRGYLDEYHKTESRLVDLYV